MPFTFSLKCALVRWAVRLSALASVALMPAYAAAPQATAAQMPPNAPAAQASQIALAERAQSFSGAYLAGAYAASQSSPQAGPYFRRALQLRPGDKIALRELLLSQIEDGDFSGAAQTAAKARSDPDPAIRPIAQLILAATAFKQRNYAAARAIAGTSKNRKEALLWVFLTSWANYGSGRKQQALSDLAQAHFSEWYEFLSRYNIALMQDLSGNNKAAAAAYEKALSSAQVAEMAPEAYEHMLTAYALFIRRTAGSAKAQSALERHAAALAAPSRALTALRAALELGQTPARFVSSPSEGAAEFAYDIGSTFLRAGEDLYADIYLQTALFLNPGNDATLFRLGVLAARTKQQEKAQAFFGQIPQDSPYFSEAQLLLALNLSGDISAAPDAQSAAKTAQNRQVIAGLEQMTARAANKAPLQTVLANVYLQSGDYPAAIALLNTLAAEEKAGSPAESKKDWALYFQRGIAYERNKEWDKAEPDFRRALELNPDNPDILNYYGYSLTDRGLKLEDALAMLRKAAELRPQDGAIADSLGWAFYRLGRYHEAAEELEKAVKLEPGESSINDHLGDAYWQTGRRLDAVFQWNHALAFNPEPKDRPAIAAKLQNGLGAADASERAETPNPAP